MANGPAGTGWAARWSSVVALVGGVTLARLAYLAWLCPYALIEDEAHYWEWSRRLDWSYYSKGPGIAWVIAASTRLLGATEFGVRLPAVLAAAVAAVAVAGLAREVMGDKRAGFYAAACLMLAPIYQINAVLMTIDMPYLAAWALACWAAWRALAGGHRGAWPALAAALAAGFLFKYTILLLVPGLAAFMWLERGRRPARPPAWIIGVSVMLAVLGLLPVMGWNAAHGWPTVHHLLGHLGVVGGDVPAKDLPADGGGYQPVWTLEFVGVQLVILGPVFYLGALGLARALRGSDEGVRRGAKFLLCCGLPIVVFYLGVTLFTEVEGNWASAGYITLLPAAGRAAARRRETRGQAMLWRLSVVAGVLVAALSLRLDWVAASPPAVWAGRMLERMGFKDDRPLIPAGRLMAARDLGLDAGRLGDELLSRTGLEPFYIAEHYGRASLLAFYIPGHPTVYCSSSVMGEGRRTQYDLWADTDLGDLAVLGGRPAVCLGKTLDRWEGAFERVEERGRLAHEPKKDRLVFLGFDYRGFGYGGHSAGGK